MVFVVFVVFAAFDALGLAVVLTSIVFTGAVLPASMALDKDDLSRAALFW